MKPEEFEFFTDLLRKRSGISIGAGKEYLAEARMAVLLEERGLADVTGLINALKSGSDRELEDQVIDHMASKETSFFRDTKVFETLAEHVIPAAIEARAQTRTLDIWSAGCSTGQEPYSISMILRDKFPELSDWDVNIVATDLADTALEQARTGSYSQLEVNRGLPNESLDKHFTQSGVRWQINDDLREMVDFRRLNLVDGITDIPQVDVVFLRNVLIYFDLDHQEKVLAGVRNQMTPSSCLYLGSSETTINVDDRFERIPDTPRSGCYRLRKD